MKEQKISYQMEPWSKKKAYQIVPETEKKAKKKLSIFLTNYLIFELLLLNYSYRF
jgi:hypothetical protein